MGGKTRFKGVCDKNGCDIQHNRFEGAKQTFYGAGDKFKINGNKKVQVTTQFITVDGTDSGKIKEVKQFYTQNGKTIDHPHYTINGNKHNSINDAMCKDWVADTKDGTNFVEKGVPNSTVRFSDIRWGPIGSTVARSDDITV